MTDIAASAADLHWFESTRAGRFDDDGRHCGRDRSANASNALAQPLSEVTRCRTSEVRVPAYLVRGGPYGRVDSTTTVGAATRNRSANASNALSPSGRSRATASPRTAFRPTSYGVVF